MLKRILIIDDDDQILKVVGRLIESMGYEVIKANGGKDGLTAAEAENPDLILLDIIMPKVDGHAVLRQLKNNPKTANIPVIMLTAKDDPQNIVDSMVDGGAVDYIIKPFVSEELLQKISKDINWAELHQDKILGEDIDSRLRRFLYR